MRPDVRVEVRFKNARLIAAVEERWGKVIDKMWARRKGRAVRPLVKVASEISGVGYSQLCGLFNMRLAAYCEKSGAPTAAAKKLSEALDREPQELFPPRLCSKKLESVKSYLGEVEIIALFPPRAAGLSPVRALRHDIALELNWELDALLGLLEPRHEKALRIRFGMGGVGEHTLREVGEELGVSSGRASQIEAVALCTLRGIVERNKRLRGSLREILGGLEK